MVVQYNFDFTGVVLQGDDAGLLQLIKGELVIFSLNMLPCSASSS